jgi:hypothetical protein
VTGKKYRKTLKPTWFRVMAFLRNMPFLNYGSLCRGLIAELADAAFQRDSMRPRLRSLVQDITRANVNWT